MNRKKVLLPEDEFRWDYVKRQPELGAGRDPKLYRQFAKMLETPSGIRASCWKPEVSAQPTHQSSWRSICKTKSPSSGASANFPIAIALDRNRFSAALVPAFPMESHTTFGGGPSRKARCRKSLSFDTITKSWFFAYFHISESGAPYICSNSKCELPGNSAASRPTSL